MKPDLPAIRKRLAEATEGPWEVVECDVGSSPYWLVRLVDDGKSSVWTDYLKQADATFIAHARTDVEELLAEVEAHRKADRHGVYIQCPHHPEQLSIGKPVPGSCPVCERDEALAKVAELEHRLKRAIQGGALQPCDDPACNCDGYHSRYASRMLEESERAEKAEAEVEKLKNGAGPDDPAGCPGGNGSACCGYHDVCREALEARSDD